MSASFEEARIALDLIRGLLVNGCDHPAEALEHVWVVNAWRCGVCLASTTDESVARVIGGPR